MTISVFASFVTLVVTIIGWVVTYRFQRKILEKQIEAERLRDVRALIVPRRIQSLGNLKQWLQQGQQLIAKLPAEVLFGDLNPEIQRNIQEWNSHWWTYETWLQSENLRDLSDQLRKFFLMVPSEGYSYDVGLAVEEGSELIPKVLKTIEDLIIHEDRKAGP